MNLDKITATASPSPNRWSDKVPSREITKKEIKDIIDYHNRDKATYNPYNAEYVTESN